MKKCRFPLILLAASILLWQGCIEEKVDIPDQVTGLSPIYFDGGDWRAISSEPPRSIKKLFKIYYKDSLLFAGESMEGIHVIDNTDPFNPVFLQFISIPGNSDIAIKGNILYANNISDLVAIDISELDNIRITKRVENAFPDMGSPLPTNYFGFFECPDPEMGPILGWTEQLLEQPQCWR